MLSLQRFSYRVQNFMLTLLMAEFDRTQYIPVLWLNHMVKSKDLAYKYMTVNGTTVGEGKVQRAFVHCSRIQIVSIINWQALKHSESED